MAFEAEPLARAPSVERFVEELGLRLKTGELSAVKEALSHLGFVSTAGEVAPPLEVSLLNLLDHRFECHS